jgi:hypothetical protein
MSTPKRSRPGAGGLIFLTFEKRVVRIFYITLTESTKKHNSDNYERHKIFLYKEDFNRFLTSLQEVVEHVKVDLMPGYDYEEFDRKQAEWEATHQNNHGWRKPKK